MNIPGALLVIAPVSLLSGAVAFWSGKQLAERYQVPVKGAAARIVMAAVFTIGWLHLWLGGRFRIPLGGWELAWYGTPDLSGIRCWAGCPVHHNGRG